MWSIIEFPSRVCQKIEKISREGAKEESLIRKTKNLTAEIIVPSTLRQLSSYQAFFLRAFARDLCFPYLGSLTEDGVYELCGSRQVDFGERVRVRGELAQDVGLESAAALRFGVGDFGV